MREQAKVQRCKNTDWRISTAKYYVTIQNSVINHGEVRSCLLPPTILTDRDKKCVSVQAKQHEIWCNLWCKTDLRVAPWCHWCSTLASYDIRKTAMFIIVSMHTTLYSDREVVDFTLPDHRTEHEGRSGPTHPTELSGDRQGGVWLGMRHNVTYDLCQMTSHYASKSISGLWAKQPDACLANSVLIYPFTDTVSQLSRHNQQKVPTQRWEQSPVPAEL